MKRTSTIAMLCALFLSLAAQNTLRLWSNGTHIDYDLDAVDSITFVTTEDIVYHPFTVAEGVQVYFAPGNLQYRPTTHSWRFATHQYDYIGEANNQISDEFNGWIDLFGWGTGSSPTLHSNDNAQYSTFVDWGSNAIGSYNANTWRTPTRKEWSYLLYSRPNAEAKLGIGNVDGVNGMILLPDDFVMPLDANFANIFQMGAFDNGECWQLDFGSYYTNSYTLDEWQKLEKAGAVFLPSAGRRDELMMSDIQVRGYYWSSSPSQLEDGHAAFCSFNIFDIYPANGLEPFAGLSVRLVRNVNE